MNRGLTCILLCLASVAAADTVFMKDGRKFEGTVTETPEGYAIKGKFGTIKVKKEDVDRVDMPPTGEYAGKAKALTDQDADGHFQLGVWCSEKGMKAEAKLEFEKALKADPNHEGAHKQLGHSRIGERWGTPLELLDSVEALLRLNKPEKAREMMEPLVANAVDGLEKAQQARAWRLMATVELHGGAAGKAADAADRAAELATATEKIAAKTRAEIIRASDDGKYEVRKDDLVAAGTGGNVDPGLQPLTEGRQPLWDERVMQIALRGVAQKDIDKGKKLAQDAAALAGTEKEKAIKMYQSAEDFFDHANDVVPDFGRQYQVEAVRQQLPLLMQLANEAVAKCNGSNPLTKDYGLQQGASGKIQFTGDGLARYQSDKRDWNAWAGKIEDCWQEITRLNKRFPAEFAQHKKACDDLATYYDKKLPEVRAFLDKIEKALK